MKYSTMFHMTNDSGLFRTREELEEKEGAYPIGGNRFGSSSGDWVPLYEGKMVQAFDHRAASIVVNPGEPTPARSARTGHPGAASECRLVSHSAVLGSRFGMKLKRRFLGMPCILGFKDM